MAQRNTQENLVDKHLFISGGGEMGERIRSKNWSATSMGDSKNWPQSLKTTLSIIINSKFPMFLFWGPEHICFYNDAYRPSLGKTGKHPDILGMPGKNAWPEIWPTIKPLVDQVLSGGEATWNEDQYLPIYRNEKMEDAYWTFSYSPVYDESGVPAGVFVTCTETTQKISTLKKLQNSDHLFRDLIKQSPIATSLFTGPEFIIELANEKALKLWGKTVDVIGKKLIDALPELKKQPYLQILENVYTTGETYYGSEDLAYLQINEILTPLYINFIYKALKDSDGKIFGILCMGYDVTEQKKVQQALEESETRLRLATEGTKLAIWDLDLITREFIYTPRLAKIFGHDELEILTHKKVRGQIHADDEKNIVEPAFEEALRTGIYNYEARVIQPDKSITWIKTQGKVIFNNELLPTRLLGTTVDITENKQAILALENSEQRLNIAIDAAELGTWELNLLTKEVTYSKRYLEILGYDEFEQLEHKEILKQIHPEDMPVRNQAMKEAYKTGMLNMEIRLILKKNNSVRWIKSKGKVFYDNKHTPVNMLGTIMDITEEKEHENALRESERLFKTIADTAPVLIWMADIYMNRYFFNKGWLDFTGRTVDQESGSGWIENLHPDDRDIYLNAYSASFKTHQEFYVEYRLKRFDGQYRWVGAKGVPRYAVDGTFTGLIGCCMDIDESKNILDKLKESETRYRQLVQSMPAAAYTCDIDGKIILFNEAAKLLWGRKPKSDQELWKDAQISDKIDSSVTKVTQSPLSIAISKGEAYEVEAIIERSDGVKRNVLAHARPLFDKNESIVGGIKLVIDITERKLAELLLQQSEEKFRLLADSMAQQIWTSDPAGNLNYYNKSVYDYSGLSFDEIKNGGWMQIVHPEDRDDNMRTWMHAVATGQDFNCEHRFLRHDGEYRWQLSRALPQKNRDGKIHMWVGTSTDIHEIKEIEQQKDFFISMASHELKTPITSIKGYVQILQSLYNNSKEDFLSNSLEKVNSQVTRLTKLIYELLDLSKIKSGSLQLNKELFCLHVMIKEIVEDIKHTEPDYNIIFSAENDCMVYADRERIGQVLTNFLTNAIKYSPNSKIINIKSIIANNFAVVSVADTGIGINKTDQEKIFQRFYRVEGKNEKTFPGFGIGLFIASEIIQRHNGRIWVDSTLGKGSVFYFSLPL